MVSQTRIMTPADEKVVRLIQPTRDLRGAFLDLAREYEQAGDDRYLDALDDFDAYISRLEAIERGEDVPEGRVPSSTFWLVVDGRLVAVSRLRHRLSGELEHEGGHIGYDVRPTERRRGYATRLLRLMLTKALERGITRVLVTCDDDNVPSARVIEGNGGSLDGRVKSLRTGGDVRRYWIDVPAVLANPRYQRPSPASPDLGR